MSTFKSFVVLAIAAAFMSDASRLPHGAAHHAHRIARRNPVWGLPTTPTTTAPADQCPFDSGANTNMAVYWVSRRFPPDSLAAATDEASL